MQKKIGTGRHFILFVTLVCLLWAGSSQAQDYPASPVQIVIPYSPGGLTDIFWRIRFRRSCKLHEGYHHDGE